jgi:two-component system, LytTR family, response regulator
METTTNLPTGLLPIKTVDGIVFIDTSQIIWLDADGKNTLIYVNNETKAIRSVLPFNVIEELLSPSLFFKCHRSHIINLQHLKKFEKATHKIQLINNHIVTISEEHISEFLHFTDPSLKEV